MSLSDISSDDMKPSRTPPPPVELTPIGFEVLLSLASGPLHGYGIKLDIEERTNGDVSLGSGTLYQAIQRLERDGLIAGAPDADGRGDARRGRTYRLEPRGRASLDQHLRRLTRAVDYARARKLLPSKP
jgi:DNA-binding PadR family transcriptional regulator